MNDPRNIFNFDSMTGEVFPINDERALRNEVDPLHIEAAWEERPDEERAAMASLVRAALLRLAEDVEEERRVFHVAITRAIEQCVVIAPRGAPSPFLDELAAPGSPPVPRVAEGTERRRDRSPIDEALFESLRRWRNEAWTQSRRSPGPGRKQYPPRP